MAGSFCCERDLHNVQHFNATGEGCELPAFITKSKSIVSLNRNRDTGCLYSDSLCAFRCLAYHISPSARNETITKRLFIKWLRYSSSKQQAFKGIDICDMPLFEQCFEINVNVYSLNKNGIAKGVYTSLHLHQQTMNINCHDGHLSYITKFSSYAKKYECRLCQKLFSYPSNCVRHQKKCSLQTRYKYPGGFMSHNKSVFERLAEWGINVLEGKDRCEWFAVYDFEAVLNTPREASGLWTFRHHPISVSIASNVDGYQSEHFILNDDLDTLLGDMMSYMGDIGARAHAFAREKWSEVYVRLGELISMWSDGDANDRGESDGLDDDDDLLHEMDGDIETSTSISDNMEINENTETSSENSGVGKIACKQLRKLLSDFDKYCKELTVLGFNSAKYDLNLIKAKVAKHLHLDRKEGTTPFIIKKNNAYICISNGDFKFLDVAQFLPQGTSYAKFLETFQIKQQKLQFPYEWFSDLSKLEETSLPPKEAFFSTLKNTNTLECADYVHFTNLLESGVPENDALAQMKLTDPPVSQMQLNYDHLQTIWREEGMTTMFDYLRLYNNRDVGPFRDAVQRFQQFFFAKSIDVFKLCVSAPGVARRLIFKHATNNGASFALFGKNDEDLYQTIRSNIIGGPSIIYHRYHKAGESLIRGSDQHVCKKITGFDASALYLHAIGEFLPVGTFVRRKKETGFYPSLRDRHQLAFHWLDWVAKVEGIDIQHKQNSGREKRVGPYLIDGYCPSTNECLEFNGCFWHFHECQTPSEKWKKTQQGRRERTLLKAEFLRERGYALRTMWECHFNEEMRHNEDLRSFVHSRQLPFYRRYPHAVDVEIILSCVENDLLFGMLEVDIEVPAHWGIDVPHNTDLSPMEYFSEMCPLFCTSAIPFEMIGKHMQNHVETHGLSKKPRVLLVGGMRGSHLLLATPLLKWYLRHGLKVSEVHQVIEFGKQRCFKTFMDEITESRRAADLDGNLTVLATLNKLLGNASFGSLIMRRERHTDIKYVEGVLDARRLVNDGKFRNLFELDDDFFEVEMAKRYISLNLPIHLGYYILQYAKLRVLQFYYDCVDVYVDRNCFQYIEMDTDSAYMALDSLTFRETIKSSMLASYDSRLLSHCNDEEIEGNGCEHWFPRTCCSRHNAIDQRTPGLFKIEFEGTEMIALCSKTYLITSSSTFSTKCSTKGSNKSRVHPIEDFRAALFEGRTGYVTNRGMRARDNTIYSYAQRKSTFTYLYCKRKVLSDGISTEPLDIVLRPCERD